MENKILSKLKSQFGKGGFHASKVLNPHKHWRVMLWLFSLITVLLILFSLYLLYQIKNEQIFQVVPTSNEGTTILKENLIKNVTETFDKKAKRESEIRSGTSNYTDPSL